MVKKLAVAVALATSLSACASITLAPVGAFEVGGGASVQLDRAWNDVSGVWTDRPKKVRLLSLDGPLLNRLYLTEGLIDGDVMVRSPRRESRTPVYASSMSVNEQVEFVAQSLALLGYERVETSGLRPVEVSGVRGARFDVVAQTSGGLQVKGIGQVVRAGEKLYVALYVAPAEHYFDASKGSAEQAMTTLTF
ncbi:MAG: hypothetical protein K2X07_10695 [Caulobacteraceae bacterium]|nr:hypothetical protein [Caulobacteraceae bacterium]